MFSGALGGSAGSVLLASMAAASFRRLIGVWEIYVQLQNRDCITLFELRNPSLAHCLCFGLAARGAELGRGYLPCRVARGGHLNKALIPLGHPTYTHRGRPEPGRRASWKRQWCMWEGGFARVVESERDCAVCGGLEALPRLIS